MDKGEGGHCLLGIEPGKSPFPGACSPPRTEVAEPRFSVPPEARPVRWQPVAGPPLLSISDLPVVGTTRSSLRQRSSASSRPSVNPGRFFLKPVFISWGCSNKGPKLVASNNRYIFSRSSGGQKMETEVSADPYSPSRGAGRVCHSQPPASRSSWAVTAQA